jgi:hypothetical protein
LGFPATKWRIHPIQPTSASVFHFSTGPTVTTGFRVFSFDITKQQSQGVRR